MKRHWVITCTMLMVILGAFPVSANYSRFDTIITGGKVIDGTENPWYYADVGINNGHITAIGNLEGAVATRCIDATGMVVAPGFIDIHTHADDDIFDLPLAENYIQQGVTTVVGGNCGGSLFPVKERLAELEKKNIGINFALLVGHGTIREEVMGMVNRAPTAVELDKMKTLATEAMRSGAFGISTGLYYAPGFYAKTDEVIELAKVVAGYGGIYTTHIRDESDYNIGLGAAVKEAIEIGEKSRAPVQISHLKCLGKPVWGKANEILDLIAQARARGVDVTFDQYPYVASGTSLMGAIIPRWAQEGGQSELVKRLQDPNMRVKIREEMSANIERRGGPHTLFIARCSSNPTIEGKNLKEIGETKGIAPVDAAIEIQIAGGADIVSFNMQEEDLELIMQSPYGMIGSDGSLVEFGEGVPHPRYYGTFPRVLGLYVREKGVLSLEEAVRKMTSAPANRLGLTDRGILREGMVADIVIFDPETVRDLATFEKPHRYPQGIVYVLLAGHVTVEMGKHTGVRAGQVLYHRAQPCQ